MTAPLLLVLLLWPDDDDDDGGGGKDTAAAAATTSGDRHLSSSASASAPALSSISFAVTCPSPNGAASGAASGPKAFAKRKAAEADHDVAMLDRRLQPDGDVAGPNEVTHSLLPHDRGR